jgi:hypothetical protein
MAASSKSKGKTPLSKGKTPLSKGKTPLSKRMMPRDVATRWNYTYEMLNFTYTYRVPYDELCGNRDMKIRKYEIEDYEWEIVRQLADILKVSWSIVLITLIKAEVV